MRQESGPPLPFYTTPKLRQLFRTAAQHPDALRLTIFLWLSLFGALRWAEITALTFDAALSYPDALLIGSGWHRRRLPRTTYITRLLVDLRDATSAMDDDLLFRSRRGGPLSRSFVVQRWLWPLRQELPDLSHTTLRHTLAHALYHEGVPIDEIQSHLGLTRGRVLCGSSRMRRVCSVTRGRRLSPLNTASFPAAEEVTQRWPVRGIQRTAPLRRTLAPAV